MLDQGWKIEAQVDKLGSIYTMVVREIETETERNRQRDWNLRQL